LLALVATLELLAHTRQQLALMFAMSVSISK